MADRTVPGWVRIAAVCAIATVAACGQRSGEAEPVGTPVAIAEPQTPTPPEPAATPPSSPTPPPTAESTPPEPTATPVTSLTPQPTAASPNPTPESTPCVSSSVPIATPTHNPRISPAHTEPPYETGVIRLRVQPCRDVDALIAKYGLAGPARHYNRPPFNASDIRAGLDRAYVVGVEPGTEKAEVRRLSVFTDDFEYVMLAWIYTATLR
jgi:hypothetical protein